MERSFASVAAAVQGGLKGFDRGRLYLATAIVVVACALGTRLYGLADLPLDYDQAWRASASQGAFADVLAQTRGGNVRAVFHPLALYVVQLFVSTPFSVRLPAALASAASVAVLVFWLPRVGVGRAAALLAGLLALFSAEAVRNVQEVREYGMDALVAATLVVALLAYLRERRRGLLCALLLLAPLVQYGLALLGLAVLLTACAAAWPRGAGGGKRLSAFGAGLLPLFWPLAFYVSGCLLTYAVALRYQIAAWGGGWEGLGAIVAWMQEGEPAGATLARAWSMARYHLPDFVAGLGAAALAFVVALAILGRCGNRAVPLLCCLAVSICAVASAFGVYPLGAIPQCLFLGPVLFVAVGHAFDAISRLGAEGRSGAGR